MHRTLLFALTDASQTSDDAVLSAHRLSVTKAAADSIYGVPQPATLRWPLSLTCRMLTHALFYLFLIHRRIHPGGDGRGGGGGGAG